MLFNSLSFLFFFPIIVALHFSLPHRYRWMLLLIGSYYFYMCWRVEYAFLILLSTAIDYICAIKISQTSLKKRKRAWLYFSLFSNLGILFSFKYANFFGQSLQAVFDQFNVLAEVPHIDLLLPVGISFYTFQSLSYTLDVYWDRVTPEKHFGIFALYVSFFPQLVAGPIERPNQLIPQFYLPKGINYPRISSGLKLMLWGFFKKMVIADNLAPYINEVFAHPGNYEGVAVWMAVLFFAFQIYCDFSGYSDIAIGSARVLGYDLMINFRQPYFATSLNDFWRRWHISLSTWFRDYLYIPLGGNRQLKWRWYYNLILTFLVSGLWHGANWTFVFWGLLHGILIVVGIAFFKNFNFQHWGVKAGSMIGTFFIVATLWIFFRAANLQDAFLILGNLFDLSWSPHPPAIHYRKLAILVAGFSMLLILIFEYFEQSRNTTFENMVSKKGKFLEWGFYSFLLWMVFFFGDASNQQFIYFTF